MIANNFHRRIDITPNICAVYVEPRARGRGVARAVIDRACAELSAAGWERVYLITVTIVFTGIQDGSFTEWRKKMTAAGFECASVD